MTHASRRPAQLAASYADHPIETTRRASLHNGLSPVRRHHLPALPADVFGPVVHEPPPPLEQVRPRVRRLDHLARTLGDGCSPLVFPGQGGTPISITRLPRLLQDLKVAAVPHGFRSSFRDWAAEETSHPREVVEAALAHVVGNQTEAAYARSDLFERRRHLMDEWGGLPRRRGHGRRAATRRPAEGRLMIAHLQERAAALSSGQARGSFVTRDR